MPVRFCFHLQVLEDVEETAQGQVTALGERGGPCLGGLLLTLPFCCIFGICRNLPWNFDVDDGDDDEDDDDDDDDEDGDGNPASCGLSSLSTRVRISTHKEALQVGEQNRLSTNSLLTMFMEEMEETSMGMTRPLARRTLDSRRMIAPSEITDLSSYLHVKESTNQG